MDSSNKLSENTPAADQKPAPTEIEFQFPETPALKFCSANVCANGHEWKPEVAMTACPGCSSPLLVVKMVQCPICNEPVAKFRLRSDHLPKGGSITPICKGSGSLAEVVVLELNRSHAQSEQTKHIEREIISKA